MNKVIGDISVESIVNTLFSKEEETPAPEDETKIVLDPEVLEELTEEEEEIIIIPEDPDDVIEDESDIAEESARLVGEIVTMELAMRTAEEYMWKTSFEADSPNPNVLKKFWDWLGLIVVKIRESLLTSLKRFQVWINDYIKSGEKWAKENSEAISKGIKAKGSEITLKIKKPIKKPTDLSINENELLSLIGKVTETIAKGDSSDELIAKMKTISEYTVKSAIEEVYGANAKSENVTIADFDKVIDIVNILTKSSEIKSTISKDFNTVMNAAVKFSQAIKKVPKDKLPEFATKEKIVAVKSLLNATEKALSSASNVMVWKINTIISTIKIAKKYAEKSVKAASTV